MTETLPRGRHRAPSRTRGHTPDQVPGQLAGLATDPRSRRRPAGTTSRHQRRARQPTTLAVLAGNGATLVIGVCTGALAARLLGPDGRGEFLTLQTWSTMLAMVLALGVSQALVTDQGSDQALFGPLIAHSIAAALAGGTVFLIIEHGGGRPWLDMRGVLGAAMLTAGTVTASNAAGLAQRRGRMVGEFQLVRLAPGVLTILLFTGLGRIGSQDVNLWLLLFGLITCVPGAYLVVLLGRPSAGNPTRDSDGVSGDAIRIRPARSFVRAALGAYGTVVGAQIIYRLDLFLVATFLAAQQTAFYGIAASLATACVAMAQAAGMIVFSRLRNVGDPERRARLVGRAIVSSLAISSATAVPLALAAPVIIEVVYGKEFTPAVGAARILLLAAIPQSVDYLLIHVLLGMRAARRVMAVQLPVGLLTAALLVPALQSGQLATIAAVSVLTYSVSACTLGFVGLSRRQAIRTRRPGTESSVPFP